MKVGKAQKMRFGRGNLAKGRAAVASGDFISAIRHFGEHARNRQRTAKEGKKNG